jgi:hypothetical protein
MPTWPCVAEADANPEALLGVPASALELAAVDAITLAILKPVTVGFEPSWFVPSHG